MRVVRVVRAGWWWTTEYFALRAMASLRHETVTIRQHRARILRGTPPWHAHCLYSSAQRVTSMTQFLLTNQYGGANVNSYQWQLPDSARTDGRLYYLQFENDDEQDFDKTYFRSSIGDWYCLSPMEKSPIVPIAVMPL